MHSLYVVLKRWYRREIVALDYLRDPILLILRIYFGFSFVKSGTGKLSDPQVHAGFFADWGIPMPLLNVYFAGTTEVVCGGLLIIGLLSRVVTIPLIVTMIVATMTAHADQWKEFWDNTFIFLKAPTIPYLFTCAMVLFHGPGRISVDYLFELWISRRHGESCTVPSK